VQNYHNLFSVGHLTAVGRPKTKRLRTYPALLAIPFQAFHETITCRCAPGDPSSRPPHAMAPNVAGVIGSAVAAGIMMSFLM
jgi:hypothetical protein